MTKKCIALAIMLAMLLASGPALALDDGELSEPLGGPPASLPNPPFALVIYTSGFGTHEDQARVAATKIGDLLKCPVRLCWNDLTTPVINVIDTAIEKIGDADSSVNEATDTLKGQIKTQIESGKEIFLIGHSAGAICTFNAVRAVRDDYAKKPEADRKALLSRIHVLFIGGAVLGKDHPLSDGWPEIGSVSYLNSEGDIVADLAGTGDFFDAFDSDLDEHQALRYIKYINTEMLKRSETCVIRNGLVEAHPAGK